MSVCHTGSSPIGEWRLLDKGVTLLPSSSEVDSAQISLNAGETAFASVSITASSDNNNDMEVDYSRTADDVDVITAFDTSGSPRKVLLRLRNNNGAQTRTVTWALWGITPP